MAQSAQSFQFPEQPANEAQRILQLQRKAYLQDPYPGYEQRRENLLKLERLLIDNQDRITAAISEDFGNRAVQESKLLELFTSVDGLRYCRKHLKGWMKPRRRHVSVWFAGASNRVLPQPKGVVGVVAPWNYPLFLVMGPLASAMAAGNRCMVKMAANSANLCQLLHELVAGEFDESTLAILPGVKGADFTTLPFDHLIFTGSAQSGRTVMKSAAEHLTPVTLELGGKSPTIIAEDFDLQTAASRILFTKYMNAGQTCVAPDYVCLPEHRLEDFVTAAKKIVAGRYPDPGNGQFTAIIDDSSYTRLTATLDDAAARGAQVINLTPQYAPDPERRLLPPHLVLGVTDEMKIMEEEIFGPLLPVRTYRDIDEVLAYINGRDRPLGLYLFTSDKALQDHVIKHTLSGGVSINDCSFHVAQHDMPFGGIGASGMGHYHGYEGFAEFSKLRPIFRQARATALPLLYPPYGRTFNWLYRLMLKLRFF
ncbi:coniferyl aldehyde dehydrogenase [Mangrovimicrobium sediminis]|uniref:Aldehyde dehydrogenase n=1 Tax=Mangrovimicrobium sediminis TaxID=2562682 RepID=A0A4Z0M1W5_9GAMM|nr:coniferyl aldehyde dehydrogenase [Haliea sp. SAOS-164]TGD73519.1 coniferyl aldehyde dehydrogenase [Haliea sp. SAOS-164]